MPLSDASARCAHQGLVALPGSVRREGQDEVHSQRAGFGIVVEATVSLRSSVVASSNESSLLPDWKSQGSGCAVEVLPVNTGYVGAGGATCTPCTVLSGCFPSSRMRGATSRAGNARRGRLPEDEPRCE